MGVPNVAILISWLNTATTFLSTVDSHTAMLRKLLTGKSQRFSAVYLLLIINRTYFSLSLLSDSGALLERFVNLDRSVCLAGLFRFG